MFATAEVQHNLEGVLKSWLISKGDAPVNGFKVLSQWLGVKVKQEIKKEFFTQYLSQPDTECRLTRLVRKFHDSVKI